jgi:hypothetical protein
MLKTDNFCYLFIRSRMYTIPTWFPEPAHYNAPSKGHIRSRVRKSEREREKRKG